MSDNTLALFGVCVGVATVVIAYWQLKYGLAISVIAGFVVSRILHSFVSGRDG